MGYFWTGIIVLIALFGIGLYYLTRYMDKKKDIDPIDFIKKYFTYIWIVLLVIIVSYLWVLKVPLWKTVGCQYDGSVRDVETKYDWIKKTCYFKTKSGNWMPLVMGRDSAEDKNSAVVTDSQEQN